MYNNRIFIIYFLIIFYNIYFNINVSSKIINGSKKYGVCNTVLNPNILPRKNDLPLIRNEKLNENLIKLNNCSISNEVKEKLKKTGIDFLLKSVDNEQNKENVINYICSIVDYIYKENLYFDSYVNGYELLDSGELIINCVENSIPENNFRLFIKDEKSTQNINIKKDDVIISSSESIPNGNYKQINKDYISKKLFGGKRILKIDPRCFISISNAKLYENLSFIVHKTNGQIYLDLFFDKYSIFHEVRWDMTVRSSGPIVNFIYKNRNFLNNMSLFQLSAQIFPFDLLNYNHKLIVDLYSDVVSMSFWANDCCDSSLFRVYATLSKNDVCALFNKLLKPKKPIKPKMSVKNFVSMSKDSLVNFKEVGTSGMAEALKETITTNLKKTDENKNLNEYCFHDLGLNFNLMKKIGNLKYLFSTCFGVQDISLGNEFKYKLKTKWLEEPLILTAFLSNSLKYKAFSNNYFNGNNLSKNSSNNNTNYNYNYYNFNNNTNNNKDNYFKKEPNLTYRAETSAHVNLNSRNKLTLKYCLTNNKLPHDFRSLKDDNSVNRFLLASHDFSTPLTFKFKIVPFLGIFLDLLVPLENHNLDRYDLSFGLKLMVMNMSVSIPLLSKLNSTYFFNKLTKDTKNFYFGF